MTIRELTGNKYYKTTKGANNMKNFTYNGKEYDFIFTYSNLDTVDKYDKAERKLRAYANGLDQNTLGAVLYIKQLTKVICDFIDEVLGEGTCNEEFGKEVSYPTVVKFKNTLTRYVSLCATYESQAVEEVGV